MRWALLLLGAGSLPAAITNVRVSGAIATQAVIAWTAPDVFPCRVEVSQSATYAPLVPDVNASLFAGANLDSRPGSIATGRLRVFVAGKRSVETASDANNYSRALQAVTTHYFRITCGADTATGSFTTATIPEGHSYGDPIPVSSANDGTYIYPTMPLGAGNRGAATIDPHTGALVKNLFLPTDIQGVATAGMGTAAGFSTLCHPTPVKASDENKYGYHCTFGTYQGLYWIASDGESRFLGPMWVQAANGWGRTQCKGNNGSPFDPADGNPNNLYCLMVKSPGYNDYVLAKGVYQGHDVPGNDASVTNQTMYGWLPHASITQIVPWARSLSTLWNEFDPANFRTMTANAAGNAVNGLYVIRDYPGQDQVGWIGVFDMTRTSAQQIARFGNANGCIDNPPVTGGTYAGAAGCFVASANTFAMGQGSALRYNVLHSDEPDVATGHFIPITLNPMRRYAIYYAVTLPSGLSTSGPCINTQPPGSTVPNWPDTTWAAGCSTITVAGEPALTGGSPAGWPAGITALPEDWLSVNSYQASSNEIMRLLDKGSDGRTWYVQRQYPSGAAVYASVAPGGTLGMGAPTSIFHVFWDIDAEPLSPTSASVYLDVLPVVHTAYATSSYGRWTIAADVAQPGTEPERLTNPPATIRQLRPVFNGLAPLTTTTSENAVDTHPSLSVTNPPSKAVFDQMVTNLPFLGAFNYVSASVVMPVGGQLYCIRGLNPSLAANYKLIPYFGYSGSRAMKEVSGPTAQLATDSSTQFQWCAALNAGECYAGSLAGDVYFNAPGVVNAYCTNDYSALQGAMVVPNDICISPLTAWVQAIIMQSLVDDPFGHRLRAISNSLSKYVQETDYWISRTLPDGSWLFTALAMDSTVKLIEIPPLGADSVNRAVYVPVSVTLPPAAGIGSAVVEFGYAENGDPSAFYCTARREACVAQGSVFNPSNPFYFAVTEAGAISGTPCQSGCTITIPAVPGRVLYYRVDSRDGSGRVVGQQVGAQAVR
jgi:hypothetical protein